MTDITKSPDVLVDETIKVFQAMRFGVVEAMQKLSEVKESEAWMTRAENWGEFCEQVLGISQGYASKLLTTWNHYVLEGGVKPEVLAGTDYEKLYAARQLPGTVEDQLKIAKTLTRREIKETKNDDAPHEHVPVSICKVCSLRL